MSVKVTSVWYWCVFGVVWCPWCGVGLVYTLCVGNFQSVSVCTCACVGTTVFCVCVCSGCSHTIALACSCLVLVSWYVVNNTLGPPSPPALWSMHYVAVSVCVLCCHSDTLPIGCLTADMMRNLVPCPPRWPLANPPASSTSPSRQRLKWTPNTSSLGPPSHSKGAYLQYT